MTTKEVEDYIDKKIRVEVLDGDVLFGELDSIAPDYDTETGEDEIELFVGTHYVCEPISLIKSILEL